MSTRDCETPIDQHSSDHHHLLTTTTSPKVVKSQNTRTKFSKILPYQTFSNFVVIICLILLPPRTVLSSVQRNSWEDPTVNTNTTYISQILNRLTDRTKYDKRLRPRYGEGAVDVGITMHIISISTVSEVDMDFTVDFYLRQTWQDPRLAFRTMDTFGFERIKQLTVGIEYLDKLWKPDTFFPNEKKSYFHTATTHNSFLRIMPDGTVYTSQRLTVTASCPMELQLFPMDTQLCKLEVESYGYTTDDIDMYWGSKKDSGNPPESAVAFSDFFLPQFRPNGYRVNTTRATTSSGAYVRLNVEVILSRNLGFYLMNIVIPSMLIVSISWVSFWLSREASPARVGLGVTTVLTMTTLITTTNNAMPKVSYIKGLDIFLNFCFIMVFASLVEYAVVSYWNKRQCRRRDRRKKNTTSNELPSGQGEFPMFMNLPTTPAGGLAVPSPSVQSYVYRPPGIFSPTSATTQQPISAANATNATHQSQQQHTATAAALNSSANVLPDCDCRAIPLMCMDAGDPFQAFQQHSALGPSSSLPSYTFTSTANEGNFSRRLRRGRKPYSYYSHSGNPLLACFRISPSKIDRCSRLWFPVIFIVFNAMYWVLMHLASHYKIQMIDYVPFNK